MSVASPLRRASHDRQHASRSATLVPIRVSGYFRWKHIADRILAALLLIPGIPLICVLCLVVRATSPGLGIFRQRRVGRGGKSFMMLKIRSMVVDAEARTGAIWSTPGDPRTTRVGKFLRKMHLDELPQLWNVLKGDMSLVGPRPERPEFTHILAEQIPEYLDRLRVHPGVTGLAQVNLPPDTDLNSVRRKILLDREYVERAGLWLDLRLLAYTSLRLTGIPAGYLTRLFFLRRNVVLPGLPPDSQGVSADTGNGIQSPARPEKREAKEPTGRAAGAIVKPR